MAGASGHSTLSNPYMRIAFLSPRPDATSFEQSVSALR